MTRPLEGVRILEVAQAAFVPSAALILVDWGADVIKVEHPERGDMARGIKVLGVDPHPSGVQYLWEIFNRGKRSIGLDVGHPEGREAMLRLVDEADVFMTNFLGTARTRLRSSPTTSSPGTPRSSTHGARATVRPAPTRKPVATTRVSYWSRNGMAVASMPVDYDYPITIPGPSFGDSQCGTALAGGIAAALYQRERTQRGCVVDVSLLSAGLWASQGTNVGACLSDGEALPAPRPAAPVEPAGEHLPDQRRPVHRARLVAGRPVLAALLRGHRPSRVARATSGSPTPIAGARTSRSACRSSTPPSPSRRSRRSTAAFKEVRLPFGVIRTPSEAQDDPQARLNGFVQDLTLDTGLTLPVTIAPAIFDEEPPVPAPAPGHATNTDDVLSEIGYSADQIMELRIAGAIT